MTKYAINAEHLCKVYGNHTVVNNVNLKIEEGEFIGIIGKNGAGKSTLLKLMAGISTPTNGSVSIFGRDIVSDQSRAISVLGFMPQDFNFNIFLKPIDVLERQIGLFGMNTQADEDRCYFVLDKVGLLSKAHDLIMTLSGGMQRRLMLARSLVTEPKVVILDEATASIDVMTE